MLDIEDILATERMFDQNKLDVRTVTMGISLLSCVSWLTSAVSLIQ